ncbi:MAG: hypothetical protein LBI68_08305 [Azoarcus sp.]|jgi:hypothetical protein|nr:hypothetical protein [Azoarcus sp.]
MAHITPEKFPHRDGNTHEHDSFCLSGIRAFHGASRLFHRNSVGLRAAIGNYDGDAVFFPYCRIRDFIGFWRGFISDRDERAQGAFVPEWGNAIAGRLDTLDVRQAVGYCVECLMDMVFCDIFPARSLL